MNSVCLVIKTMILRQYHIWLCTSDIIQQKRIDHGTNQDITFSMSEFYSRKTHLCVSLNL